MSPDQFGGYNKAEAIAIAFRGCLKGLEQIRPHIGGHARAVVSNRDDHNSPFLSRRDLYRGLSAGGIGLSKGFQGISDQVRKHAEYLLPVGEQRDRRGHGDGHVHAA